MQADMPFFSSPEEALTSAVYALKGPKVVGAMLWPDKPADAAGKLLNNCLNVERPEKLEMTQMLLILRLAREIGHHGPMSWFCNEAGYECKPVVKEAQVDRLLSVVQEASRTFSHAVAALERLQGVPRA